MKKICNVCNDVKTIKAKGMCQNCWHKHKRKYNLNFFLRTRYSELKQICTNINQKTSKYYNGKIFCTRQEFLDLFLNDQKLHQLYKNWQDSNFQYTLCPSIDRIDNNKDYVLGNLQFITHGVNCKKDAKRLSVNVYDKQGNFLSSHDYLNDAVRIYNVQQSNAWKVVYGLRKHTQGYVFKLKNTT